MRSGLFVALAMLHLVVAALFSTHARVEQLLPPVLERPLRLYGDLTGAHAHFNFFAPDVAPQARASFVFTRADGTRETMPLATTSDEANQRIAMIMTWLGDPQRRVFIMHSWCVHYLDRRPDVAEVEAVVEILDIPTIERARAGAKPRWLELQRYALRRG